MKEASGCGHCGIQTLDAILFKVGAVHFLALVMLKTGVDFAGPLGAIVAFHKTHLTAWVNLVMTASARGLPIIHVQRAASLTNTISAIDDVDVVPVKPGLIAMCAGAMAVHRQQST